MVTTVHAIDATWKSVAMCRIRYKVCEKWLRYKNRSKADASVEYLFDFFEQIASYYKEKALSKEIIWEVYRWHIERYYALFGKAIQELSSNRLDPTLHCELHNLIIELQVISKKNHAPIKFGEDELVDFIQREMRIVKIIDGLSHESIEWVS